MEVSKITRDQFFIRHGEKALRTLFNHAFADMVVTNNRKATVIDNEFGESQNFYHVYYTLQDDSVVYSVLVDKDIIGDSMVQKMVCPI